MTATHDTIQTLERQEQLLVLDHLDEDVAWALGQSLVALARQRQLPVVVDIRMGHRKLFYAALPGTSADNDEWARRKGNVALRCSVSSYLMNRRMAAMGIQPWPDFGLDPKDFAVHGGAFPLRVRGAGVVGVITVSGAPSEVDHDLIVTALARYLGVSDCPSTPVA